MRFSVFTDPRTSWGAMIEYAGQPTSSSVASGPRLVKLFVGIPIISPNRRSIGIVKENGNVAVLICNWWISMRRTRWERRVITWNAKLTTICDSGQMRTSSVPFRNVPYVNHCTTINILFYKDSITQLKILFKYF